MPSLRTNAHKVAPWLVALAFAGVLALCDNQPSRCGTDVTQLFEIPLPSSPPLWNYVAVDGEEMFYTLGASGYVIEAFNLTARALQWRLNTTSLGGLPIISIVPTATVVLVNLGFIGFGAIRVTDGQLLWLQADYTLSATKAYVTGDAVFTVVTVDLSYWGMQGFSLSTGRPVGAPSCVAGFDLIDGVLFRNLCDYRDDNLTYAATTLEAVDLATGNILWRLPGGVSTSGNASFLGTLSLVKASSPEYILVSNVTMDGEETALLIHRTSGYLFRTLLGFNGFSNLSAVRPPRFVDGGAQLVVLLNFGANAEYAVVNISDGFMWRLSDSSKDSVLCGNSTASVGPDLTLSIASIFPGRAPRLFAQNATDVFTPALVDLGRTFLLVETWEGFRVFDTRTARCVTASTFRPAFQSYATGVIVLKRFFLVLGASTVRAFLSSD